MQIVLMPPHKNVEQERYKYFRQDREMWSGRKLFEGFPKKHEFKSFCMTV